jgi:D-alanine-D-alanine ligase
LTDSPPVVAVLYQALPAPEIDGVRKPMKPGGYSDSGADIAFTLQGRGIDVVTPTTAPSPTIDIDWVFPDTSAGISEATDRGATVLWANTVLFDGHPLQSATELLIVGQDPGLVHRCDDKWFTNSWLRSDGRTVATSALLMADHGVQPDSLSAGSLTDRMLDERGLHFPMVIKPVRGRGSEGVRVVADLEDLLDASTELSAAQSSDGGSRYGVSAIVEEYLPGQEITITVMPAGRYDIDAQEATRPEPWALPAVTRFNHVDGVAPYNGVVAVARNSRLVPGSEVTPQMRTVVRECELAARLLGIRAPIRIDCRAASDGQFRLFDLNMKPNMTGPGRPGRDDQDSLSLIAAKGIGWSYSDLLLNMLANAA